MGGFKGVDQFSAKFTANIGRIDADFENAVDEVTLNATTASQEEMVFVIDSTPSALSPGKVGRNWTREMRNRVDSKVAKRGRRRGVQAGWLSGQKTYFLDQDRGTGIVPAGQGMHMLMAGFKTFQREMDKGLRRVKRERNKK